MGLRKLVSEIPKGLSQEEIQNKAVEMEMLRQNMQQLDQQLIALETRKMQIEEVLKAITQIKGGEDILLPLGPGFFIKGNLKKTDKVIVAVGANMALEKRMSESKDDIEKNLKEIDKISNNLKSELLRASEHMEETQKILIKYYGG